ncbi:MAG: hypothetical protein FJY67_09405 [Calditrichaeota bacterium]|nr:hypothetical protein [Calditrichota bacterium]
MLILQVYASLRGIPSRRGCLTGHSDRHQVVVSSKIHTVPVTNQGSGVAPVMMTTLRSQMKTILWILVVAFLATIVFSWGMGGFKDREQPGILGMVNGDEVTLEKFELIARRKVEAEQRKEGGQLDADKQKQLREDVWDEQVERMLKMQEASRLGIEITDREIAHIVEFYPPNEIRSVESFQRDGQFDLNLYRQFLRRPEAASFLLQLEESVRNYLLEQKLLFQATSAADVTPEQIRDEVRRGTSTAKLRFVFVPNDKVEFDSSSATDEMLQRYYRLFPDRYKQYAQRRFAFVKFKVEPSGQDSIEVENEIEELLTELQSGADFEALARQRSEDAASAEKGGDLDWFGKGAMTPNFEEACLKAQIGEIVGPVQTKFGLHIIRVDEKKVEDGEPKMRAHHILLKYKASPDTRDEVYNTVYAFAQDVSQSGFDQSVAESNLSVDTTKAFSEAGYIAGLGRMRMAAEFCFNNPVGTASEIYPIPDGYVVLKIVEATDERVKPFDEVRDQIRRTLIKTLRQHRAAAAAAELRGQMGGPQDLEAVALAANYPVYVTDDSMKTEGKLPDGVRADKDFITKAFRLKEGELSDVIEGRNGAYVAVAEAKFDIEEDNVRANYPVVYINLVGKEQQAVAQNWVRELRIAADIKDYRYRYFRDF